MVNSNIYSVRDVQLSNAAAAPENNYAMSPKHQLPPVVLLVKKENLMKTLSSSEILQNTDKFYNNNNDDVGGGKTDMTDDVQVIKFNKNSDKNGGDEDEEEDNCDCDIISEYIGHYGWWQFFWTFLLGLLQCPSTFQIFAFVFQASKKKFWCAQPDFIDDSNSEKWKNLTSIDPCKPINLTYFDLFSSGVESFEYTCESYEYEFGLNIITEWNLVCGQEHTVSMIEMCLMVGAFAGSISSGWLSDKFGRKPTLIWLVSIQAISGTLSAYSTSLTMFMILRVIIGFVSMGVTMVSFVLVVELVSGKWRTIIGILDILPVAISYIIMACIAYVTPDWRTLQFIISVPWFSYILIWYHMPESPRWLLENGRIDELVAVIKTAAKWNKIELPENFEKTLQTPDDTVEVSFLELFKSKYGRTTFLMIIVWYAIILLYFGITLHLSNLGGNIYLNTVIAGLLESVSVLLCILVVLKLGLKINLVIYMLVAGIGCLLVNVLAVDNYTGIIALAMLGKCAIGATNALIPTFTAIQYPTTMRTLSVGVGNFAAGFALITVPYLWLLEHIQKNYPMTIMGIFGIVGAVGLLLMKDKKLKLYNSKDVEQSKKQTKGVQNNGFHANE